MAFCSILLTTFWSADVYAQDGHQFKAHDGAYSYWVPDGFTRIDSLETAQRNEREIKRVKPMRLSPELFDAVWTKTNPHDEEVTKLYVSRVSYQDQGFGAYDCRSKFEFLTQATTANLDELADDKFYEAIKELGWAKSQKRWLMAQGEKEWNLVIIRYFLANEEILLNYNGVNGELEKDWPMIEKILRSFEYDQSLRCSP